MSSFIKLTPLSGAKDENFLCYLLEIDQIKILLDCGWSEQFDVAQLESLEKVAKHIDAVLISHADLPHIGAYPYAVAKFGLACPVYVTTPVHDMGQACLIDAVKSQREFQDFTTFSLTDINEAMSKMTLLRYSQPFSLQGKCQGISVTPFGAGHTIGGTIWKIKKDSENIVYTVDYNHRKERHLNGSELMTTEILSKPTLLITDTLNALMPNPPPRKERDRNLISICMETLQASGNVLIPVESTTRVLELAYLLDQHWAFNRVHYHLVFLTHQSQKTITLARSMLEWMGDGISQAFAARELPFDFRSLKNLTSMGELEALVGPKVVLTSFPGMEFGYSKHMLLKWASDPGNTVILPEKGPAGSLSRKLYDFWRETSPSDSPLRSPVQMNFDIEVEKFTREPLAGEELEEFEAERKRAADIINGPMVDEDMDSEPDEEAIEMDIEHTAHISYDIIINQVEMSSSFFKQQQAFKMYPIYDVRPRIDDYGEIIDMAEFKKFEVEVVETEMGIAMSQQEDKKKPETMEIPSKYSVETITLECRCKVHFIDFEGRSDGKSIRNILQRVAPKRLILVHGSHEATDSIAEFCRKQQITDEIYSPAVGECVDVSSATNLFQIVLTDSLLENYKLGYVSGVIRKEEGLEGDRLVLDLQPFEEQKSKIPVTVGDVKLSELKKQLGAQGYNAQFVSGGVLVVNESIVIQKTEQGRLTVQGQVDSDYYKVRKILYTFQAIL